MVSVSDGVGDDGGGLLCQLVGGDGDEDGDRGHGLVGHLLDPVKGDALPGLLQPALHPPLPSLQVGGRRQAHVKRQHQRVRNHVCLEGNTTSHLPAFIKVPIQYSGSSVQIHPHGIGFL